MVRDRGHKEPYAKIEHRASEEQRVQLRQHRDQLVTSNQGLLWRQIPRHYEDQCTEASTMMNRPIVASCWFHEDHDDHFRHKR